MCKKFLISMIVTLFFCNLTVADVAEIRAARKKYKTECKELVKAVRTQIKTLYTKLKNKEITAVEFCWGVACTRSGAHEEITVSRGGATDDIFDSHDEYVQEFDSFLEISHKTQEKINNMCTTMFSFFSEETLERVNKMVNDDDDYENGDGSSDWEAQMKWNAWMREFVDSHYILYDVQSVLGSANSSGNHFYVEDLYLTLFNALKKSSKTSTSLASYTISESSTVRVFPDPKQPYDASYVDMTLTKSEDYDDVWVAHYTSDDDVAFPGNYKFEVKDDDGNIKYIYTTIPSRLSPDSVPQEDKSKIRKDLKALIKEATTANREDTKEYLSQLKVLFKAAKQQEPVNFREDLVELMNKQVYQLNYTTLTLHEKACDLMHKYGLTFHKDFDMSGRGMIAKYNSKRVKTRVKLNKKIKSLAKAFCRSRAKGGTTVAMQFPFFASKLIKVVPTYNNMLPPAESPISFQMTALVAYTPKDAAQGNLFILGGGADHASAETLTVTLYDKDGNLMETATGEFYGDQDDYGLWKCSFYSLASGLYQVQAVLGSEKTCRLKFFVK